MLRRVYEYVKDELKDLLKITDLVITRAGANSIFEFLLLRIPNILIPLSKKASRGDQILNAKSFEKQGFSKVILEEELSANLLMKEIKDLLNNKDEYLGNMKMSKVKNGTEPIVEMITKLAKEKTLTK